MSSPDLFVVCKSCGSEVSPYVTECPYCGTRLRKRAPKIEREGGPTRPAKPSKPAKPSRPAKPPRGERRRPKARSTRLPRLRTGEIPGLSGDQTARPWATIVLVALSFGLWLSLAFLLDADLGLASVEGDPWRFLTAPLLNVGLAGQLTAVVGIGLYGWLLERRHGALLVVLVFLLAGSGGLVAAATLGAGGVVYGGQGAALGLLAAWAIPILLARRRGAEDEADMLGTAVIALVLLLVPVAGGASAIGAVLGGLLGTLTGFALAVVRPR